MQVLGREVYTSNNQLGGIQIMHNNGVTHTTVPDDFEGVFTILQWLSYMPKVVWKFMASIRVTEQPFRPLTIVPLLLSEQTLSCARHTNDWSRRQRDRIHSYKSTIWPPLDAGWKASPQWVSRREEIKVLKLFNSVISQDNFLLFCTCVLSGERCLAEWILRPRLFHGDLGVLGSDGGRGQSTVNLFTLNVQAHKIVHMWHALLKSVTCSNGSLLDKLGFMSTSRFLVILCDFK